MPEAIDFYFEFASPYGYFAGERIDAIGARHGREVRWHPIMLGAVFKLTGSRPLMQTPLKGAYMHHDLPRFARYLGLPLTTPPVMPVNSLAPSRAVYWRAADDPAGAKALAQALYRAHWGEGRDIGEVDEVVRVAGPLGIDGDALRDAIALPAIKQRLKDATQAALERGVFGSPFVFVDDQAFWGADRLDQIDAWLARGGW